MPETLHWWSGVLDGGLSPLRRSNGDGDQLRVGVRDHGELDVVSGRLKVAAALDFADVPPLDGTSSRGVWLVTSLVDPTAPEQGPLLLRVHRGQRTNGDEWRLARVDGHHPMLPTSGILIGDADSALTLGNDEWANQLARLLAYSRSPYFSGELPPGWTPPDGATARELLPASTVRSFYSPSGSSLRSGAQRGRPAYPQVWVRGDEEGQVTEVVVDLVAALWRAPYEHVHDAWATPVENRGGRLTNSLDPKAREDADISSAFVTDVDDFQGTLVHVGDVALSGEVVACDPGTRNELSLPIVVDQGLYPVFVVFGDFSDLLLLRLGAARATTWYDLGASGEGAMIPIETGTYALCGRQLLDAAVEDPALRARLRAVGFGGTPEVVDFGPHFGGAVSNGDLGGDMPAWCYLGLDNDGNVCGLVVTLVTDYILGNMPADQDAALMSTVSTRVTGLPRDHDWAESWRSIQQLIQLNGGRVTRTARSSLHNLAQEMLSTE